MSDEMTLKSKIKIPHIKNHPEVVFYFAKNIYYQYFEEDALRSIFEERLSSTSKFQQTIIHTVIH